MKKLLNQSISSNKKLNFKKDKFQTLIIGVSEAKTLDGDLKVINEVSNGTIKKLISRKKLPEKLAIAFICLLSVGSMLKNLISLEPAKKIKRFQK